MCICDSEEKIAQALRDVQVRMNIGMHQRIKPQHVIVTRANSLRLGQPILPELLLVFAVAVVCCCCFAVAVAVVCLSFFSRLSLLSVLVHCYLLTVPHLMRAGMRATWGFYVVPVNPHK